MTLSIQTNQSRDFWDMESWTIKNQNIHKNKMEGATKLWIFFRLLGKTISKRSQVYRWYGFYFLLFLSILYWSLKLVLFYLSKYLYMTDHDWNHKDAHHGYYYLLHTQHSHSSRLQSRASSFFIPSLWLHRNTIQNV